MVSLIGEQYPLRITAKYLQVDYNSIIVGCREVGDGWSGSRGNETESLEPDAWAGFSFARPTTASDVGALITKGLDRRP
jgi:hypothetical protein